MDEIERSPLAIWQAYLKKGQLSYQWSPDAKRAVFHPRVACPYGGQRRLEWRVSAGLGRIYSTTQTTPTKGDPYNVALIELDEGFRMMSRVEGASGSLTEIGRQVRLSFVTQDGVETPVPIFLLEAET